MQSGEAAKVGVGASEAARALGMAPALVKEQLLAAESQGLLFLCSRFRTEMEYSEVCLNSSVFEELK